MSFVAKEEKKNKIHQIKDKKHLTLSYKNYR